MKKKVMVGMSGGVDSSVAAMLLMEQGYDVVGVTFRLWHLNDEFDELRAETCCSLDDVNDAREVCYTLGIPHYVFNYKDLFRERVVDYFVEAYRKGHTPNPCIACNRHIKFDAFLQKADDLSVDCIATGHYARILQDAQTGRYALKKALNLPKDQSYVLFTLTQKQLARTLMPLGSFRSKDEVRGIAEKNGLVVSRKKESQDICFVPDGDYTAFLERYTGEQMKPGPFVDKEGRTLGEHRGIWNYTIGQRKGLGLSFPQPMFVVDIRPEENAVVLGISDEVFSDRLTAGELNWIETDSLKDARRCKAKIRYAHTPADAVVSMLDDGTAEVRFDTPQRAVTKGQAVVFYDDDTVIGGGTIQ